MILKPNEKQTWEINGRKIGGLNITPFMLSNAVNVAQTVSDYRPENITVKLQLQRTQPNGKLQKLVIFSDNLKVLAMETAIGTGLMSFVAPAAATAPPVVLVPAAVATAAEGILPMKIDFGGCIDLLNDDKLILTVNSNGNEFSSAIDTALSFTEVNWYETDGVEFATPIIQTDSVSSGESNNVYNVGDACNRVVFINTQADSFEEASQIIDNVNVVTSRFQTNDNWNELQSKNAQMINSLDYALNAQSAILMQKNDELQNKVGVDIQFISANVSGGENFIVSRKFVSTTDLYNTAVVKSESIKKSNVAVLTTSRQ